MPRMFTTTTYMYCICTYMFIHNVLKVYTLGVHNYCTVGKHINIYVQYVGMNVLLS
jgi:hypothetical protein